MKRDWDELERKAGINRTVPRAYTQRDVENLTVKKLWRNKTWRAKFRRDRQS